MVDSEANAVPIYLDYSRACCRVVVNIVDETSVQFWTVVQLEPVKEIGASI